MNSNRSSVAGEDLSIRAAPAPIRQFSKKALAIILAAASALVLGSFALAMKAPERDAGRAGAELYSTTNKPHADGLAVLPASYADVKRDVPALGPPLPGDLGAPMLRAQREGRLVVQEPLADVPVQMGPDNDETAELLAEQISAARQSALFFSNARQGIEVLEASEPPIHRDPFEVLDRLGTENLSFSAASDPGFQSRKETFLNEPVDDSIYNPHRIETPVSPWQVMAGTIIPATLLTGINSDLPGQIIGQVTEPVYDTVTGATVLIPQGSRIIGRYDSVVAFGQARALIVWQRIIMPDGTSIRIENLPGVDARGYAGLRDKVDHHTFRLFSAAALSSLITIGAELSQDEEDEIARALRDATQQGAARAGEEIIRRQLAVQPTIKIRPGWRLRIIVHQDLILQPYGDN